jgi:hypothetical protein
VATGPAELGRSAGCTLTPTNLIGVAPFAAHAQHNLSRPDTATLQAQPG